jgi:glycosyltransferase involved in cell wall biosynthesis
LKLFEYMAAGVPVVAADLPSFREILSDGETALLVPPEDPEALAGGIRRLLDDPSLARKIRANALERVRHYSWQERARRIIPVLEAVQHRGAGVRAEPDRLRKT